MSFNVYYTVKGDLWVEEIEDGEDVTFNFQEVKPEDQDIVIEVIEALSHH